VNEPAILKGKHAARDQRPGGHPHRPRRRDAGGHRAQRPVGGERHRHALGWRHYLARLALAATGRDVAPRVTPAEIVQGAD
jgi:hypothetical protein